MDKRKKFNPEELIRRYHASRKGILMPGDKMFTRYTQKQKVDTYLIEGTWTHIILLSILNAFLITACKYTYIYHFGRPDIFHLNDELAVYQIAVEERTRGLFTRDPLD